jgi:hypothetical protein
MHSDQIQQTWGSALVSGLQERYGLTEHEARRKFDEWLASLTRNPTSEVHSGPEYRSRRRAPRQPSSRMSRRQSA